MLAPASRKGPQPRQNVLTKRNCRRHRARDSLAIARAGPPKRMAPSFAVTSLGVTLRAVRRGVPARALRASAMASLRPAQPPIVLGATKARGWACHEHAMRCSDPLFLLRLRRSPQLQ